MQAVLPLFLFLALYVLLIRPQRQRANAQRALLSSIEPGDRVITAGGMIGTLRSMDATRATVEVAPGVIVEMVAPAIKTKLPAEGPGTEDPGADTDTDITDTDITDTDITDTDINDAHVTDAHITDEHITETDPHDTHAADARDTQEN